MNYQLRNARILVIEISSLDMIDDWYDRCDRYMDTMKRYDEMIDRCDWYVERYNEYARYDRYIEFYI